MSASDQTVPEDGPTGHADVDAVLLRLADLDAAEATDVAAAPPVYDEIHQALVSTLESTRDSTPGRGEPER